MRRATILGIGTAVPPYSVKQDFAVEHAKRFNCTVKRQERVLEELYRRTEINSRCSVLGKEADPDETESFFSEHYCPSTGERMEKFAEHVIPLSERSCRAALEAAQIEASSITHLVTVCCTGFFAPGFDIALIKNLPLSPEVTRAQIGFMGCHGAINAIKMTQSICEANLDARVLVCATELCSLHFQYGWNSNGLIANSLFADGSAALVASGTTKLALAETESDWTIVAGGSCIVPESEDALGWVIGNSGFQMNLSASVPDLVLMQLRPWIEKWLAANDLAIAGIANWAIHPGGPRILDAAQASLRLSNEKMVPSRMVLNRYGNMSSPSVLFALQEIKPGTGPCVMLGFGPGLAIEAVLLVPSN